MSDIWRDKLIGRHICFFMPRSAETRIKKTNISLVKVSDCGSIRMNPWSKSFGLVLRIKPRRIELIRTDFKPIYLERYTKRFSDWFGRARISSDSFGLISNQKLSLEIVSWKSVGAEIIEQPPGEATCLQMNLSLETSVFAAVLLLTRS